MNRIWLGLLCLAACGGGDDEGGGPPLLFGTLGPLSGDAGKGSFRFGVARREPDDFCRKR